MPGVGAAHYGTKTTEMPRYYFHVKDGVHSFDDETGEELHGVQAAEERARQIARDLGEEPETYRGYTVVVVDAEGNTIANVSISED